MIAHCSMFKGRSGACRRKSREEEGVCAKMDLALKKSLGRGRGRLSLGRGGQSRGEEEAPLFSPSPCSQACLVNPKTFLLLLSRGGRGERDSIGTPPPSLSLRYYVWKTYGVKWKGGGGEKKNSPLPAAPLCPPSPSLLSPVGVPAAEASFGGPKFLFSLSLFAIST